MELWDVRFHDMDGVSLSRRVRQLDNMARQHGQCGTRLV